MSFLSTSHTHPSLPFQFTSNISTSTSPFTFSKPNKLRCYRFRYASPSPNRDPRLPIIPGLWGQKPESETEPDPEPEPVTETPKLPDSDPPVNEDEWVSVSNSDEGNGGVVVVEEEEKAVSETKTETEPETETAKLAESDPPVNEDELVSVSNSGEGNGGGGVEEEEGSGVEELKRCLVDTVYGTGFGFRAGQEVRAEVAELVCQLEGLNPKKEPVQAEELLNGNWVLLYTASSELLPLLAAGSTSLLKVERICQSIDTGSQTIMNSTSLSTPLATFSFSAAAAFEVRSPARIQVQFKEGTFQPPEIKSKIDLPNNVDIFGQKINLVPLEQSLRPLQELVASISRAISGQPPLKLPIPGERTKSWLLTTYLDKDLRISRGDGGLFVLAKEGSLLLNQY